MAMAPIIIGIDLGTTNSCVGVCINGVVEIIRNELGRRLTPSCVTFADNEILIGQQAKDQSHKYLDNSVYEFKRLIGQKYDDPLVEEDIKNFSYKVVNDNSMPKVLVTYKNQKKIVSIEELGAFILTRMRKIAETQLARPITQAVITIPAYFNDSQRRATIDAGKIAGFNKVNIINEPTAAALAFNHLTAKSYSRTVLVYDLGGGTFDVSIVTLKNGICSVKATDGDCHLGGKDLDLALVEFVEGNFENLPVREDDSGWFKRLLNKCEKVKIKLSHSAKVDLELQYIYKGKDICFPIERTEFEHISKKIIEKTINIVEKCLTEAKLEKSEINEILLVGGCTRMPMVKKRLQDFFNGKELNDSLNPDEAVAYGAAVYAASLDKSIVRDVTALSLGIECIGDVMCVTIPRNSRIPIAVTQEFYTSMDDQTTTRFTVYQGDDKNASNNHQLGEMIMTGLTPRKAGDTKMSTSCELNNEGILKITAFEIDVEDNRKEIKIDMNKNGLSEAEIEVKVGEFLRYREDVNRKEAFVKKKSALQEFCLNSKEGALQKGHRDSAVAFDEALKILKSLEIEDEKKVDDSIALLKKNAL